LKGMILWDGWRLINFIEDVLPGGIVFRGLE
jgi:hypothetical protein